MQRVKILFEKHKDMVYRLALSYTGNPQDAQDISQEVFLRLIRWIDRIKVGSERSWLAKVTVNCCKNLHSSYERCHTRELLETDAVLQPEISFSTSAVQHTGMRFFVFWHQNGGAHNAG